MPQHQAMANALSAARTFLLALALTACAQTHAADADVVDAVAPDASIDDILCTGMPVREGPPCPIQDPAGTSRCGGEGGAVFNGDGCFPTQGSECGGERGAFNTVEACAVTCARAGQCRVSRIIRGMPTSGAYTFPRDCSDTLWVVTGLLTAWSHDTSRCAYFAGLRDRTMLPLSHLSQAQAWEFIRAVSLMPSSGLEIHCFE